MPRILLILALLASVAKAEPAEPPSAVFFELHGGAATFGLDALNDLTNEYEARLPVPLPDRFGTTVPVAAESLDAGAQFGGAIGIAWGTGWSLALGVDRVALETVAASRNPTASGSLEVRAKTWIATTRVQRRLPWQPLGLSVRPGLELGLLLPDVEIELQTSDEIVDRNIDPMGTVIGASVRIDGALGRVIMPFVDIGWRHAVSQADASFGGDPLDLDFSGAHVRLGVRLGLRP